MPERRDDDEPDPLAAMLQAMFGPGGVDPEQLRSMLPPGFADMPGFPKDAAGLQAVLAQVQQMFAGGGDGPVNWDAAHDVARAVAAQAEGGDPAVTDAEQRQVAEALRTADLWLDRVTELPSATARSEAWSRAEWVEKTLPTWKGIVEPIAASVAEAMSTAMAAQAPEEMRSMIGGALPMVRRMGGAFFGAQLGQALGALAGEVVGAGDTGIPLLPAGRAALLPANVAAFGAGLGLDGDEVRLYLALREAAHARLIAGVPWLRAHLLGAVEEYARGITIDADALEEAVRSVDPSDPEALQEALSSGLFEPQTTPQQRAALDRLGPRSPWWRAGSTRSWTPRRPRRCRTARRCARRCAVAGRRAGRPSTSSPRSWAWSSGRGGSARRRPCWAALTAERGIAGRDALWAHPDLAPTEESFADPVGFAKGGGTTASTAMDEALAELLDQRVELGDDEAPATRHATTGARDDRPGRRRGRRPAPAGGRPVTAGDWRPREGLVADLRHAIARAPRDTPEERFEAWAWRALLDEHGAALLTRQAAPSHVTASAVVLSPDAALPAWCCTAGWACGSSPEATSSRMT